MVKTLVPASEVTVIHVVRPVKKAIENGTLERLIGDDFEEVASILGMIDAGITGHLVDVNTPKAQVVITVEYYED
jgi:hypothetical protein